MSFDINNAIGQMINTMKSTANQDGIDISTYAAKVLDNQKESLAELVQARLDGDLDQAEFEEELQREKLVAESELLALEVMGKAMVQKALNAAFEVLVKMVVPI